MYLYTGIVLSMIAIVLLNMALSYVRLLSFEYFAVKMLQKELAILITL